MHCIVPFAAPSSDAGRAAMASMSWPRLEALLARLSEVERDEAEPTTYSPPHERALARALGWRSGEAQDETNERDGRWPFAARELRASGVDPAALAWGLVSPVHWHVGTDQVSVADPQSLRLTDEVSRRLFDAVAPLFLDDRDDAADLRYAAPTRWYAAHESLRGLRTASLDRVIGRNVDPWLVGDAARDVSAGAATDVTKSEAATRRWRRLQAEVQMLLHVHPLNAEREAAGLLPVNSFWLSGCGVALPETPAAEVPIVDDRLRASALAEDWAAWAADWRGLEEETLPQLEAALLRDEPLRLTLCGERTAATWAAGSGDFIARMKRWLGARPAVPALLASL
jgi:hypothetical protein